MTFLLWALQFIGSVGLAITLPKEARPLRWLAAISALADLVEVTIPNGTDTYAYVYWGFRIVELNWLLGATALLCGRMLPMWRWSFQVPIVLGWVATLANWLPRSNQQMQIYQTFMLMTAVLVALFAVGVGKGLKLWLLLLALGLICALQLACTLIWRAGGYSAAMYMIAWLTGLLLLWQAAREPHLSS